MKISYKVFKLLFISLCFVPSLGFLEAQSQDVLKNSKNNWTSENPFGTDVFIENFGQFDAWTESSDSIKYAINSNDRIFFTPKGLIIKLSKAYKIKEGDYANEEGHRKKVDNYFIAMEWVGCNANCTIEAGEPVSNYYTFGEKGYENIQAKGYRNILYKNLYPGIDVEYTIPEKGGIKYQVILHPGADPSLLKMKYSGDLDNVVIDNENNISIKTQLGNIIDHAPVSFYEGSTSNFASEFVLEDTQVSFKISAYDNTKTVIIDPWTTPPSTLITDGRVYDIGFDDYDNVYVSGGTFPCKLAKYSNSGSLLWTFTYPSSWAYGIYYSAFCVLENSGTSYIGEGCSSVGGGALIMKIGNGGTLTTTAGPFGTNNEIWEMFYNRCSKQLIAFGGGTSTVDNMKMIIDTSLSGSISNNFNGFTGICCNDIADAEMDNNGDFYAIGVSASIPQVDNHLFKSTYSSTYSAPCAFDVLSGTSYVEGTNYSIIGFSIRTNALSLNNDYLYSYDGQTLSAWNKTTGALLSSVVVSASYTNGQSRTHEGIVVDECNNVYVGGTNMVHMYTFDGTAFISAGAITTNITAEVYDIRINKTTNCLYISGVGFVTVVTAPLYCNISNLLDLTDSVDACLGNACVTANGGIPPFNYLWSNGATTNCISGVAPGMYIVTVTDNSCILQQGVDTVYINSSVNVSASNDTSICATGTAVLSATGGVTYTWSPATGLSSTTGSPVNASPAATTTYTVTGTSGGCSGVDTVVVSVISNLSTFLGNDTALCGVSSYVLDAGNPGSAYLWSTTETTQTISIANSGTYWVSVTNGSCSGGDTINIIIDPAPLVSLGNDTSFCDLSSFSLDAGNAGSTYLWSSGETTQTINVTASGDYWVSVSNSSCSDIDTVNLTFSLSPVVDLGNDTLLCGVSDYTLDAGNPGSVYLWSTGDVAQSILLTTSGTYWVSVTNGSCSVSDTIQVTLNSLIVDLGNDTSICGTGTIILDAGNTGAGYQWSSGDNTQTIAVTASGIYWVAVSNGLCTGSDTISIAFVSVPVVNIGNDTTLCSGQSMILDAGNPGALYDWSTGEHSQTISVSDAGTYWVTVRNGDCVGSDTVNVYMSPNIDLGRDVSLCEKTEVTLSTNVSASSYLWSNGAITPFITVDVPGEYWLILEIGNCELSDTVNVTGGNTSMYVPNAFTPDKDDMNEVFLPLGEGITKYNLMIFTRWGQVIFKSEDMNAGWDGSFEGRVCENGTYVWVLTYRTLCTGDRDLLKIGNVTLIR